MPVDANFGILQPVDIGGRFNQSFQLGKQQRAESETDAALASLAQDPNADISGLAKYNPRFVMQVNAQRQQQQQAAQQAQTTGDALTGNPQARGQVAYFDPELYLKLEGRDREQAKQGVEAVAQAALWADTPQKWDAIVAQIPGAEEYRGRFGEREAIIAQAGEMKSLLDSQKPGIGYVPDGASAYATNTAGETVLQALNGQQGQPQPQQGPQGGGKPATYASPEQVATLKASMGEQAAMQYLQERGIDAVEAIKNVGGKEYFQINGQWFEN